LQIIHIFGKDEEGRRAFNGGNPKLYVSHIFRIPGRSYSPLCRDVQQPRPPLQGLFAVPRVLPVSPGVAFNTLKESLIDALFLDSGNDGRGLGASHQTGCESQVKEKMTTISILIFDSSTLRDWTGRLVHHADVSRR
jgi:hypothetical protein